MSRRLRRVVGVIVALVIAAPVATYAYIHWLSDDAPAPLTVDASSSDDTGPTTSVALSGGLGGTWVPTSGSQLGYRVDEVLLGQQKEAVGRTAHVSGEMTITATTVSTVTLTADMTTVASDQRRRDNQFHGRIMDTSRYPTATFELTSPIGLPSADATTANVDVTGRLTLRGTTRSVTFPLEARRTGGTIRVSGTVPIVFADYGIPNPSFGPVSTEDHGEMEFLVVFAKQP